MAQRNDQVFQLSLTEIAFTIAFLLLLLLGYLVFREQAARQAAEAALARVQDTAEATAALADARRDLGEAVRQGGSADPERVITELLEARAVRAQRDRLRALVDELDARLSALVELQKELDAAAPTERADVARQEIGAALALQARVRALVDADAAPASGAQAGGPARTPGQGRADDLVRVQQALVTTRALQRQLRERLGRTLAPGQESQAIAELVAAAGRDAALARAGTDASQATSENADLRGQVAFLQNRLGARGGRDYPPCWADDGGKVEFLFAIELEPGKVSVTPAWPAHREAAARALPGIADVLAGPVANAEFERRIRPLFDASRRRSPECRHYVQLRSAIADAVQSDRARLMVEGYFYKSEVRR